MDVFKLLSKILLSLFLFLVLVVPANAQIVNGDFGTNDFTGWSVYKAGGPYPRVTSEVCYYYDSLHIYQNSFISQDVDLTDYNYLNFDYRMSSTGGSRDVYIFIDSDLIGKHTTFSEGWSARSNNFSYSGIHTLKFLYNSSYGIALDNIILGSCPTNELIIAGSNANQNWYVNQTDYPDLDVYFQEIVDYQIDNFNVTYDYYINCTTSNDSYPYTYNYFIDDNNGDSMDNSIYSRMSMETKILYPDTPTTYTFHLYEVSEIITDKFPWYYWLIYPLYMLIDLFTDEEDNITFTEIDAIEIALSKISGDNETIPDIPQESEGPEIPDPEPDPDKPINWTIPDEPPTYEGANQTVNVSWTDGYYNTVNGTVSSLCSPMYNFTNWSLSPIQKLNTEITNFNYHMNASFTQTNEESNILYESVNTIFNAIHPKIRNVITYYLVWLVLLLIMRKR